MATKRKADESSKQDTDKKKPFVQRDAKKKEKLRFLLVGKTGSGKSSTGNTILGQHVFTTDVSFISVTDQCQLRSAVRFDTIIDILDSPGLFDTEKSEEEVSTLLMQAVACLHPGPDAVFYVLKMERYRQEEFAVYNRLKALLDEKVTKHMILVITHGDSLKGQDMENVLKYIPDTLTQVLEDCDRRYVVMDNTLNDSEAQVRKLLEAVRLLKEKNQNVPYTCPKYASVADSFEKELNRRLAEVEEKELEGKKYVQELSTKLEDTEQKAKQEREEFEKKDRQRQREMEAKKQEMNKRCQDLTKTLKQQQLNEKERAKQVKQLEERVERERREFEEKTERERKKQEEEMRRLEKKREEEMKALWAEKKEFERKEREMREEMERKMKQEIAHAKKKKKGWCVVM